MRLRSLISARRRRRVLTVIVTLLVASATLLVYLDEQHRFDVRTETFTFESGDNTLAATLHLPIGPGPHGLVVFVPGDGTSDADPGAMPVWEALAQAGYATVKWDKPGVRDSTGNWLDQDMTDRANEAIAVVDALADHDDLDVTNLGVIGISQGGWVLPLVAERIEVDFFIAWSTAINWAEQGDYFTAQELLDSDADADLAQRVRDADTSDRGSTYLDYLDWHDALDSDVQNYFSLMTEDRWGFAIRNQDLDVRNTLPALKNTPVLLMLGEQDDNVDIDDTERVYREILGESFLTVVRYPGADHNLLDHDGLALTLAAIVRPRSIFANDMLDDIRRFTSASRTP